MSMTPIRKIYRMLSREVDALYDRQNSHELSSEDLKKLRELSDILSKLSKTPDPNRGAGLDAAKGLSDEDLVKLLPEKKDK